MSEFLPFFSINYVMYLNVSFCLLNILTIRFLHIFLKYLV